MVKKWPEIIQKYWEKNSQDSPKTPSNEQNGENNMLKFLKILPRQSENSPPKLYSINPKNKVPPKAALKIVNLKITIIISAKKNFFLKNSIKLPQVAQIFIPGLAN